MSFQFKLSLSYHEKATKMHAATIAEEHDKVATIYSDLGEAHGKIRNQDQAKEYHEKALIIWRKIYAEENPDVASTITTWEMFTVALYSTRKHKTEYHAYEKVLIILRMIHGEDYPDIATSYDNLGVVCCSLAQYKEGNEHHKKLDTDNPDKDLECSLALYKQAQECHENAPIVIGVRAGGARGTAASPVSEISEIFRAKRS